MTEAQFYPQRIHSLSTGLGELWPGILPMTAFAIFALFSSIALLAMGTIASSWRAYHDRFAELRRELWASKQGVAVRYSWREAKLPRPTATVYNLRFTPPADCLPFHPEHELPVAA